MSQGAMLILLRAPGEPPMRWELDSENTTIGRGADCDVVLDGREVSRTHAVVRRDGSRFALADLGSKNGTLLNGARLVGAAVLKDGDEIVIAPRHRLRFVDQDATVAARIHVRGVGVDKATRSVSVHGRPVVPPLAPHQYALLTLLISEPGRVFSRDEIAEHCYPDARGGVSDLAIDGLVRRLRARLAEIDPDADFVVAVRGHGFYLSAGDHAAAGQ